MTCWNILIHNKIDIFLHFHFSKLNRKGSWEECTWALDSLTFWHWGFRASNSWVPQVMSRSNMLDQIISWFTFLHTKMTNLILNLSRHGHTVVACNFNRFSSHSKSFFLWNKGTLVISYAITFWLQYVAAVQLSPVDVKGVFVVMELQAEILYVY